LITDGDWDDLVGCQQTCPQLIAWTMARPSGTAGTS
jgi:hypothetical protein